MSFLLGRKSGLSGDIHYMMINTTQGKYKEYMELGSWAPSIQNYFPELTPDEHEFIMTGITPTEWKETFGEEE